MREVEGVSRDPHQASLPPPCQQSERDCLCPGVGQPASFRACEIERAYSAALALFKRTPGPSPLVNSIPRRSSSACIFSRFFWWGSILPSSKFSTVLSPTPAAFASSTCVSPRRSLAALICRPETFIFLLTIHLTLLEPNTRIYRDFWS